jgi:hypothetical protein
MSFHAKTKDLGDHFQRPDLTIFQLKNTSDFSRQTWCNGGKKTYF